MAELIQREDSLNTGREKINEAIKASERAESKSDYAVDTAETALSNSESTQTQLDTIVIDGDSSVEAAQARVDSEGNVYNTLKERLDEKETEFSSQLAEIPDQINDAVEPKADIAYVDNRIDNLDGLQFKGAYQTLQDLENDYPNGTSGLFVVHADNHWYYWNGTQWEKGNELMTVPWTEFMTSEGEPWEVGN